ncbi:MAG: hypothetical protein IH626_20035 [Rhodospirillales bacterium]|nr:hypothetical protein [Rhodospirillales bacterium]
MQTGRRGGWDAAVRYVLVPLAIVGGGMFAGVFFGERSAVEETRLQYLSAITDRIQKGVSGLSERTEGVKTPQQDKFIIIMAGESLANAVTSATLAKGKTTTKELTANATDAVNAVEKFADSYRDQYKLAAARGPANEDILNNLSIKMAINDVTIKHLEEAIASLERKIITKWDVVIVLFGCIGALAAIISVISFAVNKIHRAVTPMMCKDN